VSKFKKTSQMPMMPEAPQPEQPQVISGPLDAVEKILVDSLIQDRMADVDSPENIALGIWEEYGGKVNGGVHAYAIGKRTKKDEGKDPEELENLNKMDDSRKWERLPRNERINDVTSLEQLTELIKKSMLSFVKQVKGKSQPAAPAGMPML
jgi:hypothetical protein